MPACAVANTAGTMDAWPWPQQQQLARSYGFTKEVSCAEKELTSRIASHNHKKKKVKPQLSERGTSLNDLVRPVYFCVTATTLGGHI